MKTRYFKTEYTSDSVMDITPGKAYKYVKDGFATDFTIKDDAGDLIGCSLKSCAHLDGYGDWIECDKKGRSV